MFRRLSMVLGVLLLLSASESVLAQAGAYSFSSSSGTYTPLGATATNVPAVEADEGEADVPIGFDFEFEGTLYDTVAATSNGFISFVEGATSTTSNNLDNGSSSRRPLVAPLWDDLDGNASSSAAAYELSGTAPNRVFTFEWRDWEWDYGTTDSVVSFQVKLYETTNIIEFTYRWECHTCISGADASIGISGANTFLSVTGVGSGSPSASFVTEDSNIDTVVTDQVFTFTPPSCIQPTALSFSNIGTGSVDVDWATGGASNWQISYDTTGSPAGANITNVTTAPPYNLTGLPTGVPLDIYVRDSCGVGNVSFWAGPVTVVIPCGPQTAPYSTNFDQFISGYDPFCWNSYASSGSSEVVGGASPRSGSLHLELDGTSSTDDTLISITPQFSDLTANDKQVRFYAKSTSTLDTLFVGSLPSLSVSSTFSVIDTIVFTGSNYAEYIIPITTGNGYNGSDEYLVFMHSLDDGGYIYIDDFNYEVMPPCPKITQPYVASVGVDSAVIGFATTATSVRVEWGPAGFGQGTGCTGTVSVVNGTIVLDNSIDPSCVNPFMESTCYDVYLQNDCSGSSNGLSLLEGPISFCTPCSPRSLPYTESFDNGFNCFTVVDSGATDDTWFWAPAGYTRGDLDGTGYILVDSDAAGSEDMLEYAVSPNIDASSITGQLMLEFDQYFNSWSSENADVEVWDGTQWVTVLAQSGSDVGSWSAPDRQIIDVTAYANANFQVRFHYYNANFEYYWAIDNFRVYESFCPASTDLAAYAVATDSISLNWKPGQATSFGIEYGPMGFAPGSGTLLGTADTFITVQGLTAQTTYDFYLYDSCAAGTNPPSGPLRLQTLCPAVTAYPFTETFNSGSTTENCWTVLDENGDGDAWNLNYGSNTYEGDEVAVLYTDFNSGNNDDWLISPPISLSGNEKLEYYFRVQSQGEPNDFEVLLSTTGINPSDFTDTLVSLQSYSNTSYTLQTVNLSAYTGPVQLAWHVPQGGLDGWRLYIDSVVVDTLPPCPDPSQLSASNIQNFQADIDWTDPSGNSWIIEWGPSGFQQGSGVGNLDTVSTHPYTLTGLGADSCYDFYVQNNCGVTGTSAWVGPLNFCTLPTCPAPTNAGVNGLSITTNSADVYWTSGGASDYNVEYGAVGFNLGTGTMLNATNDTFNISGLSANTTYEFYVRDSCAVGDVSRWTGPVSFTTLCNAVAAPYVESFDTNAVPTCWVAYNETGSGWEFGQLGDAGYDAANAAEKTGNGGYYAWVDFSGTDDSTNLQMQSVDVSSLTTPSVQFWMFGQNSGTDFNTLYVEAWSGTNWVRVDSIHGDLSGWRFFTYDLSSHTYNTNFVRVRFRAESGGGGSDFENDLLIDDVTIDEFPTCPAPTNLGLAGVTVSTADVYWTTGGASNWNVEYGPVGFVQGNGNLVNATNDTTTITGLSGGTSYEFYVRDSCGAGDVSMWMGPYSFTTVFTTNYIEDFTTTPMQGWSEAEGRIGTPTSFTANSSAWSEDGFANNGSTGAQSVNIYTDEQYEWLISPSIYLDPAIPNLQVEFDVAITEWISQTQGYLGADDTLALVISTDAGQTWSSSNIIWYANANDTVDSTGMHVVLPLSSYSGIVQFGFYAGSANDDVEDNDLFIDNFEVRTPRACANPSDLTVSHIATDTAVVTWTEGTAGFVNAELILTTAGQPVGAGTLTSTSMDSLVVTGLSPATDYCVYVVEECANGFSDTIGPVCFTTKCLPQSLPYTEDFATSLGCFSAIDGGSSPDTWEHVQDYGGSTLDGTPFAFVDSDGAGSGSVVSEILESVQLDASSISGALVLTYDMYFNNASSDSAVVEVYDGSQWQVVTTYKSDIGAWSAPFRDSLDITAYANAALQVRFRYEDNNIWAWYWAVDNVSIREVSNCAPTAVAASVAGCDTVDVTWSSAAGALSSDIEYGPVGFTPGTGTMIQNVSSPYTLSGLALNTEYDLYVIDSCAGGKGTATGPATFKTDSLAPVMASFTHSQSDTTLNDATVDFDASASTGDGLSYSWDFDGSTGNGMTGSTQYTANGTYNVVLTVTDRCGQTDDTTITITVGGISIIENSFNAEVSVYPNPNNGQFKVNVTNTSSYSVEVVDLTGKKVYAEENIQSGTPQLLDMGAAAPGVYFVRFTGEGLNATQRVVIR